MKRFLSDHRNQLALAGTLLGALVLSGWLAQAAPKAGGGGATEGTGGGAAASVAGRAPKSPRPGKAAAYRVVPVPEAGTLRVLCKLAAPYDAGSIPLRNDVGPGKCGHDVMPNERAQIQPGTLGLANCVVSLPEVREGRDFEGELAEERRVITLDQIGCRYVPHVMLARVGSRLAVKNSDPVQHNVKGVFNTKAQPRFNLMSSSNSLLPPSEDTVLDKAGLWPLNCDIHWWMTGYIRTVPHPYFAVSGPDGVATLTGVPAGTHVVACWHEGMVMRVLGSGADISGYQPSADFDLPPQTVTVPAGGTVDVTFVIEPR